MRMNRTATLAIALMIAPVALVRSASEGAPGTREAASTLSPAAQETMDAWLAALNEGAVARLDAVLADSIRLNGRMMSRHDVRRMVIDWRAASGTRQARAFPLVSDGEVVGLWTWSEEPAATRRAAGMPALEPVHWLGADFLRLEDGRIVEGWLHANRLGLDTSG